MFLGVEAIDEEGLLKHRKRIARSVRIFEALGMCPISRHHRRH